MVRHRSATSTEHHFDALANPRHELGFVLVAVALPVNDLKMFHMHILAARPPRDLVYALLSSAPQVVEELGRRLDRADRKLIARPGARHVEQLSLRVVHFLQIPIVADALDS